MLAQGKLLQFGQRVARLGTDLRRPPLHYPRQPGPGIMQQTDSTYYRTVRIMTKGTLWWDGPPTTITSLPTFERQVRFRIFLGIPYCISVLIGSFFQR